MIGRDEMQIPACTLKQSDYLNFPELEEIDLSRVDRKLILGIQALRTLSRIPMIPSPVEGAWSRVEGSVNSRHYAIDRLSDAGDLFPARDRLMDVWLYAVQMPELGGIGVYFDTDGIDGSPWPMIHLDLRPTRLLWACYELGGERIYEYFPAKEFWNVIAGGI